MPESLSTLAGPLFHLLFLLFLHKSTTAPNHDLRAFQRLIENFTVKVQNDTEHSIFFLEQLQPMKFVGRPQNMTFTYYL